MADKLSPEKRSLLMSQVRGKDTAPEMLVRSALHRDGYRYSLHRKDLPGKPDIVFGPRGKVVFVHGCFWHGHRNCNQGGLSKSNREFWKSKIAKNRARDRRVRRDLISEGWEVMVVWSCELRSSKKLANTIYRIQEFLES